MRNKPTRTLPVIAGLISVVLMGPLAHAFDTIVVINEIHYHPAGTDDPGLEFVEVYNQNTVNVDLAGWRLSGEVDYEFASGTVIEGGRYLVVAANPAALEAAAGISGVLGPFVGELGNGGGRVRLRTKNDRIVDEVEYNDRGAWPVGADGSGASLSKIDPQTTGALASHWAASVKVGGTPRATNFGDPAVPLTLNEVGGSQAPADGFFVELYNAGAEDLDLEGYVIASESGDEFVIPAETTALAGTPWMVSEADLGFRAADGDNLYLYGPEKAELLDALRADDLGRARYPDGSGSLLVTAGGVPATPGEPNAAPLPSPVVINEIMYKHRPTYADVGPPAIDYAANDEEWIELYNTADVPVPVGGWELAGGVRFTIPPDTTIPEGGYLVIARDALAFAAKFPDVPVVGDFSGSLSNRGEEIIVRDAVGNPADQVFYRDGSPWPGAADGGGSSMELRNPLLDNASPDAWRASDNSANAEWHDYEFTMRAVNPTYSPGIFNFHELRIGLLDSGEVLLDDISVVEDPSSAARELIPNGAFRGLTGWVKTGTHQDSRAVADEGERVLHLVATARMNYLNNLIEGALSSDGSPRQVRSGVTYKVSFRAKWLSGSPQFRFELYYNKLARTVILRQPEKHGTPGAQNSTYEEATGPVYRGLTHSPAVPQAGQDVEVSVVASDPDGIGSMVVFYGRNGGSFVSRPMVFDEADGRWKGTIPGQPNGTLMQFYVEGKDASPEEERSFAPAGGARARAIVRWDLSRAHGRKHAIRINMLPAEASAMHNSNDILSNYRTGCTIIADEEVIAYDAGIRLRGSMFSRSNPSGTALNLKFPADRRYRGVHSTITTRRANRREILVKHIINAAGGIHESYNDILYQYGHSGAQTGEVRSEMGRFGRNYLRGLPVGNGEDGTIFKMEGIREFQQTQNGRPDTPKLPFPIGWISSFDLANQGDDKEAYRHNMRINTNLDVDNYDSIIRMGKMFSRNGQALEDLAPTAINVDNWCRKFAMLSLCGIGDTYSQGNPHNLNFYVRPDNGLVEAIPWDWDFTFNRGATSPLWGNRNVAKLFARPVYTRLFHGHLRDIIRHTYNSRYLTEWFEHYGFVSGESYNGFISYVSSRGNYVLSQLPAEIPFQITTNGGDDFSTSEPSVTLTGGGWIDVREVFLNDAPEPVELTWTDSRRWEFTAPLVPGENTLSLVATNHQGSRVGSDTIVITHTGSVEAAGPTNIAIGELNYHPAGNLDEEFIEIVNIGAASVDLTGVSFTNGVDFSFPAETILPAGGRLLVVENQTAFEVRYGEGLPIIGEFANETRLNNGGERIRLEALGGETIREFTYDTRAPWPEAADEGGHSLVLIAPASNPDHADPFNWRASVAPGGNPGGSDAAEFAGDPNADDNGDGLSNFMNHAFGPGGVGPILTINSDGTLDLAYSRNLAADDVIWFIEISEDLDHWEVTPDSFGFVSESLPSGGLSTVVYRRTVPPGPDAPVEFVRLRVEKR